MNANQIRHIVSAFEDSNLMEARVTEVRMDHVEIPVVAGPPMFVAASTPLPEPHAPYIRRRSLYLERTFEVNRMRVKAAYDYQTHTIFFRRVR